jgi:hypothetical protein
MLNKQSAYHGKHFVCCKGVCIKKTFKFLFYEKKNFKKNKSSLYGHWMTEKSQNLKKHNFTMRKLMVKIS